MRPIFFAFIGHFSAFTAQKRDKEKGEKRKFCFFIKKRKNGTFDTTALKTNLIQ